MRLHRRPEDVPHMSKLDPLRFLLRSAMVHAQKKAIIHHQYSYTYLELSERVKALANLLIDTYNVKPGDRVAILCQNIPAFMDGQFAIPAIGAIIVPVNTRLAAKEVDYVIEHSGASVLMVQEELADRVSQTSRDLLNHVIIVADSEDRSKDPYEQLIAGSKNRLSWKEFPTNHDENATISLNYTSGSTGKPKGVMVSYRGAYMMAMGMAIQDDLNSRTVFLWTLPMFHCNGK